MLIEINSKNSLDKKIGKINKYLFNAISGAITSTAIYDAYPRAYKNKGKNNKVTYEFIDELVNYKKDLYFNDEVDLQSFFIIDDKITFNENNPSVKASFIIGGFIDKIFNSPIKQDEFYFLDDVIDIFKKLDSTIVIEEVYFSPEKAYQNNLPTDKLFFTNQSKMFIFTIKININYKNC